jgi:hypothetical protein
MLKNNISGGFVNRRKVQIIGFKLLHVLQEEEGTPTYQTNGKMKLVDIRERTPMREEESMKAKRAQS